MFEWDPAKAISNLVKHNVSFELACVVFKDPFAVEWQDDSQDYGEDRFLILGIVEGRVLHVTYVERNGNVRLISARRAEAYGRRYYHEENA